MNVADESVRTVEPAAPEAFSFEDLEGLPEAEEFRALGETERELVLDQALMDVHAAWQDEPDYDYATFAEYADGIRRRAGGGVLQKAGEGLKGLTGVAVEMGKDMLSVPGAVAPAVMAPVETGKTVLGSLALNTLDWIRAGVDVGRRYFDDNTVALYDEADRLVEDLRAGKAPVNDPDAMADWLREREQKLLPMQEKHAGTRMAQEARLTGAQMAALVGLYAQTRNPKALDELHRRLTKSGMQGNVEQRREELMESSGGKAFDEIYGKGASAHLVAGFDPANMVFAGRGVQVARGASRAARAGRWTAEMAGWGTAGALRADPNASAATMGEETLKMMLVGGALKGGAWAARRLASRRASRVQPAETEASASAGTPTGGMSPEGIPAEVTTDPALPRPADGAGSSPAAGTPAPVSGLDAVFRDAIALMGREGGEVIPAMGEAETGKGFKVKMPAATTRGFVNTRLFADAIEFGAGLVGRGVREFGAWAGEMIRRFGDAVREVLRGLWEGALRYFNDVILPARGSIGGGGGLESARGARMGATGPGDALPETGLHGAGWETPRASQRTVASDALKGAWHAEFDPAEYERRSVKGWAEFEQAALDWTRRHGPEAAAALAMDETTGIPLDARPILAGVALREADRAAQAAQAAGDATTAGTANALATRVADFLGTYGSRSGQAVRAYGFLAERDPFLTLADFERKVGDARLKGARGDLGASPEEVAARTRRTLQGERKRAADDVERGASNLQAAARRIVNRLAMEFSDTAPEARARAVSDVMRLHALVKRAIREDVPDLAQQARDMGVPETEAGQLATLAAEARKRAAAVARERAAQKLIAELGQKARKRVRTKVPVMVRKLLEAAETGALGRAEFLEAYAEAFGLQRLTPEQRARVAQLAREARDAPEGSPRLEATARLQNELAILEGIPARDALVSAWYANILSGLSTQGINVWGNLHHLLSRSVAAMAGNPREAMDYLRGMIAGARQGAREARRVLRTGLAYKGREKYSTAGALEQIALQGGPKTAGQWAAWILAAGPVGRYVFRGLGSMDSFFYYTAMEGRAHLAAARAARAKGHKPGTREYELAVEEELGLGRERWDEAMDQAAREGFRGTARLRRAYEIVEAERPQELRDEAHRYGDLVTYNFEPEGNAKPIYEFIKSLQDLNVGGVPITRPFVPFARMVANLTTAHMDFLAPIGILRGATGRHLGGKHEAFAPWEARERMAAGIIGGAASATVLAMALANKDENDADAPFMIYGSGPPKGGRREQWLAMGGRPFSIKIGNKIISYAETPLVFALAPVGAAMDMMRYSGSFDEKDWMNKATYLMKAGAGALTSQGVLSSVKDLFDTLSGQRDPKSLPAKFTAGLIPMQGLLRDMNTLFDPRKIDADTVAAGVLRDVPVIRGLVGKPALNVWGEPVKFEGLERVPVVRRFITSAKEDPTNLWLARHGVTIPAMPQNIQAGSYMSQEDKTARANRLHANIWSDAERYEFSRRSGRLAKERVGSYLRILQGDERRGASLPDASKIQSRIDGLVMGARRETMLEMVGR